MTVDAIPEGYHTVTPYLMVHDAAGLIDFVTAALDAEERLRMPGPEGSIGHAEVMIGDSVVMLADAAGEATASTLHLYVEDADATYERALAAGATSERAPRDEFYGDRMAGVRDAFGNTWWFATHREDLSESEMVARAAEQAAGPA
jgi:PhnB protein